MTLTKRQLRQDTQKIIEAYKEGLHHALLALRKALQEGQRPNLHHIYDQLNCFSHITDLKQRQEIAFNFQLALLALANEPISQPHTHWLKLLPIHVVNAVLTVLCYMGFHLSVWKQAPAFCIQVLENKELCENEYFISPLRVVTIFPLAYLAACIVAPENTKKWLLYFYCPLKGCKIIDPG